MIEEKHYKLPMGNDHDSQIDYLNSFVEYPMYFLTKLAAIVMVRDVTEKELTWLMEFIRLDTYALQRALDVGVHPITGNRCPTTVDVGNSLSYNEAKANRIRRGNLERLIVRNNNWLAELEKLKNENGCGSE